MHAERDHLVRFVFPELKEKCRKNHVHLIDVDLRWGVTEADAQDGKALDICLDEIDSCRPYFLGLLGHRYGWVPPGEEHSITAQEIYHGVLHNEIPKQILDLRRIIDGKLEGKALTQKQINCLVSCYPWDADKGKYLLREDASDDELEIIRAVFMQYSVYQRDRSFFFFRSETLTRKLAGAEVEDYFESDKKTQDKLDALKQDIIDAGLPCFEYDDIEVFGEKVGETLWQRIEVELGEPIEEEKDWLEEEAKFHELFAADRTRRFVGRRDVLDRMHGFCEQHDESSVMTITGEPGCGKSALMGRFSEEIMHDHPDWSIIPHFVGASPTSTNLRQTLRRLCTHLSRIIESPEEVPEDIKELIQVFPELLTKAAEQRRLVMLLDAVNQFEKTDDAQTMRWLPPNLPENIRFVISTVAGEAFDALKSRTLTPKVEEVTGLNEPEVKELVIDYLKEIRHEFPNKQVEEAFFHKVKAGNPLYIQVALEELRVFGKFEKLSDRVDQLPDTVPALFDQVLERIEFDFNPKLVRDCMSYIACGRQGMTADELQTLLIAHAPQVEMGAEPKKLPDMLWARLYRAFGAYLFERSGVIDFFHGQLKEAVGKRYLEKEADRNAVHKIIADYFEKRWRHDYIRALAELPHQRKKARDLPGVERILCDLEFIESKCMARMTYDLTADYEMVGIRNWPPIVTSRLYMKKYGIFCPFCVSWFRISRTKLGAVIACPKCSNELKVNPFTIKAEWHLSHFQIQCNNGKKAEEDELSQSLVEFADFVSGNAHLIELYPEITLQQAHNLPTGLAPERAAGVLQNKRREQKPWLRLLNKSQHITPLVLTLVGHTKAVNACDYSPNGRQIASVSDDETLRVWDAWRGAEIFRIETGEKLTHCSYSPGGQRILTASSNGTLTMFDAHNGMELYKIDGHPRLVMSCKFSPDGHRVLSVGSSTDIEDGPRKLWDTRTGELISTVVDIEYPVASCAFSPDGRRYVTGPAGNGPLILWDMESGSEISRHGWLFNIKDCAFSPDGKLILAPIHTFLDEGNSLKIWEADTWKKQVEMTGAHRQEISACAFSPDGNQIVSSGGTDEQVIRTWDAKTGKEMAIMVGHSSGIKSCTFSPDGQHILSASRDNTLKIWNANTEGHVCILPGRSDVYSYSPDGSRKASVVLRDKDSGEGELIQWEAETERIISGMPSGYSHACAYSPDGKTIVSRSSRSEKSFLRLWDAKTMKELVKLKPLGTDPRSCIFSPDGRRIAASLYHVELIVWDLSTGKMIFRESGKYHSSCAYSPDGRYIATVSGEGSTSLSIRDARTFQQITQLSGSYYGVNNASIAFGKPYSISTCIYSPDGQLIVTGSNDGAIKIWDLDREKEIACFFADNSVYSLAFGTAGLSFCAVATLCNEYLLRLEDYLIGTPIVTIARLFRFETDSWDEAPTARCQWCGKRLPVSDKMLDVIGGINRNAGLSTDQSPCIELPEDAWDEPRLLSECPHCKKPLKFNPFIVDNRV
jgi:telomerase protein component 1